MTGKGAAKGKQTHEQKGHSLRDAAGALKAYGEGMFTFKKTYVLAAGVLKLGLALHTAVFTEERCVCSACGVTFEKRGSSGVAMPVRSAES